MLDFSLEFLFSTVNQLIIKLVFSQTMPTTAVKLPSEQSLTAAEAVYPVCVITRLPNGKSNACAQRALKTCSGFP